MYYCTMKYLVFIFVIIIFACTHDSVIVPTTNGNNNNGNNNNGNNPIACDPDTVYFQNEILPMLISNCAMSGCHNATSHQDGVILTDFSNVINTGKVKPFNPSKSDLYESIIETDVNKRMPYNLPAMSIENIAKIKKWIDQGALNNYCTDCDTTGVIKYSKQITAIMQTNCTGCHGANNPSAGISLINYVGVQTVALNGTLLGAVNHTSGFKAMPQGAAKLSVCDITSITKWIQDGAQNN